MSIRLILAASAALALAAPAFAQDAPAPSAPAATEQMDPVQAAFEAKGEAFGDHMRAMAGEMQAAVTAAGGDSARANAALDAIVARYQPEADSLAVDLQGFLDHVAATSTDSEKKAQLAAQGPMAIAQIKGVPAMVRAQIQAAAAAPAAPVAPQ